MLNIQIFLDAIKNAHPELLTIQDLANLTHAPVAYIKECLHDPAFNRIVRPNGQTLIPLWRAIEYWDNRSNDWYDNEF